MKAVGLLCLTVAYTSAAFTKRPNDQLYTLSPNAVPWKGVLPVKSTNPAQDCKWATYKTQKGNTGTICLHDSGDQYVSGSVLRTGRWYGCDLLPNLYEKHGSGLYIDIGANIGTCVLTMLLDTNATIVAFEPNPNNLFCLTSTLLRLPLSQQSRVSVFPFALGSTRMNSTINAPQQNMGNGVVGKIVKDFPSQVFNPPIPIQVEVFDQVIPSVSYVPVLKIDVQGFECEVIRGAKNLINVSQSIMSEIETKFLDSTTNRCSAGILKLLLKSAGFTHKSHELFERIP